MASTVTEAEKAAGAAPPPPPPPPPEVRVPAAKGQFPLLLAEVVLRLLVFGSGVSAVVVMVISKERQVVAQIPFPPFLLYRTAKFNYSPAFIFFVAALATAGLYGLITTIISFFALCKPGIHTTLISYFIIFDVLLLGIVAAATGAAGGVAYIGLKGDKHVQWNKICNLYGDFCKHVGASIAISLFGSVVLVLLVILSVRSLSKRIPKHNHSH